MPTNINEPSHLTDTNYYNVHIFAMHSKQNITLVLLITLNLLKLSCTIMLDLILHINLLLDYGKVRVRVRVRVRVIQLLVSLRDKMYF